MAKIPKTQNEHLSRLIDHRERVFHALQIRKTLGSFDANSEVIVVMLEGLLSLMSYQILKAEQDD